MFEQDRLSFSNFSALFSTRKQSITWVVVWIFSLIEEKVFLIWVSYCFNFRAVYCCSAGHDGIFISLQESCSKINLMLNWLVCDTPGVVTFSALEKSLKIESFQASAWSILINLQIMLKFLVIKWITKSYF